MVQGRGLARRVRQRPQGRSDCAAVLTYVPCEGGRRGVGLRPACGKVPGEASERVRAAWLCLGAGLEVLGDAQWAGRRLVYVLLV